MRYRFSIILLIAVSVIQALYGLGFERMFPEVTGEVQEINHGYVTNLGEYGYFFVTPDSGLVYYNNSYLPEYHQSPFLSVISASCISDYVTDKIFCALGAGSYSDGIYSFDTNTKIFSLKTWLFYPKFVKYLNSGFYAGAIEGLIYSADGNEWNVIEEFSLCEISDVEETSDSILFVGAKVPRVTNAVLFMKNGDSLDSLNTEFGEINDIFYRKSGDYEEVLVTLGSGSYSDGLYKVQYNDSTITGLELIKYIFEPNLIILYPNYYIVTSKNTADMVAVPFISIGGESLIIEHGLDIDRIYCYSRQYPIYTPNFMIGTDSGVYMATGTVGIEDTSVPSTTELHQNYPNPFNPETSIKYSLSNDAQVKLNVYDIGGREVARLVSEKQTRGNYDIKFNGGNMTSGLYFYRLDVDGKTVQSRKMMLLK